MNMMSEPQPGPAPSDHPPALGHPEGLLRALYRDEWTQWKSVYRPYFKAAARALGLGFVLGFAVFLIWPAQEKKALLLLVKALKDIPLGAPPLVLALTLFYHNARASLLAVAAGAVPFLCLPVLDPFMNGAALGLLASVSKHQGLNVPLLFLKSVVPHGLFELPAVLYAASAGIHLSVTLGRILRARLSARKEGGAEESASPPVESGVTPGGPEAAGGPAEAGAGGLPSAAGCLAAVARSFILVVLPLLLVAAFIEAFITPALR
jgi:stage II sporulation protein M